MRRAYLKILLPLSFTGCRGQDLSLPVLVLSSLGVECGSHSLFQLWQKRGQSFPCSCVSVRTWKQWQQIPRQAVFLWCFSSEKNPVRFQFWWAKRATESSRPSHEASGLSLGREQAGWLVSPATALLKEGLRMWISICQGVWQVVAVVLFEICEM